MPLSSFKKFVAPLTPQNLTAGMTRDVIWDRPLFRPPFLPNPRVMFDPLPFMAQRPQPSNRRAAR